MTLGANNGTQSNSVNVISDDDGSLPGMNQQLNDFLYNLEDYTPTVPYAVTKHYLQASGFESADSRIVHLISIAAQKFISDIANDALQHCKTRTAGSVGGHATSNKKKDAVKDKDRRYVLTMDDLTPALQEYGITVKKPQYFV